MTISGRNYYLLTAIYFALFVGLTFTGIKSTEFMGIDERSIIEAINGLFQRPYYNMLAWYHSRAYGWSYMVLTAIFLSPFKLIFHVDTPEIINYVIKLVLFFIGLATVLALYRLSTKITKNNLASIAVVLAFMLTPSVAWHLFTVHPDSTGMLFFLLGSLFFLRFSEHKSLKNYLCCLACLVISSLAKQPFFFMALPVLMYMLLDHCNWKYAGLWQFLLTFRALKVLVGTAVLSLMIAFIIHPHAFFNIKEFVAIQTGMSAHFSTRATFSEAMINWVRVVLNEPIIFLHTILFFLVLVLLLLRVRIQRLFVYSVVISTVVMLLFMVMQRETFGSKIPEILLLANVLAVYISPLYPLFLINLACAFLFLYEMQGKSQFRLIGFLVAIPMLGYLFLIQATQTINVVFLKEMLHTQQIKYASYSYIESLPKSKKIVYDPNVAMPADRHQDGCHIWRGCNEMDHLERFRPDYIILNKDYPHTNWAVINQYISDNNFCIIEKLSPSKVFYFNPKGFDQLLRTYQFSKSNDTFGASLTIWSKCY